MLPRGLLDDGEALGPHEPLERQQLGRQVALDVGAAGPRAVREQDRVHGEPLVRLGELLVDAAVQLLLLRRRDPRQKDGRRRLLLLREARVRPDVPVAALLRVERLPALGAVLQTS